jgi:hypothetical protein
VATQVVVALAQVCGNLLLVQIITAQGVVPLLALRVPMGVLAVRVFC